MQLIIAEKPSQAKAYAEAIKKTVRKEGYFEIPPSSLFPKGAYLTWGIGHLVSLKDPHDYNESWGKWKLQDLPIIPESFQFKVPKDKKKQFSVVKELIGKSSELIVATDSDREGENIARSIIELSGGAQKPTKRLWINSLEEDEVIRGFENLKPGEEFYPFYQEAQARQISDWIVGLNASRLYTLLLQQKGMEGPYSVGRVQTPTLKLIYDRQKEIENFVPKAFYELESTFLKNGKTYKGKYKKRFSDQSSLTSFLQSKRAQVNNLTGTVTSLEKVTKQHLPPKLHSLSSLQTLANKKYKYSPSQVTKIVQSLYDSPLKLVTYPRTDTQHITENEFKYLKDNLKNYQKVANAHFDPISLESNKRFVDNKKVQEHYAIVTTKNVPSESTLASLTDQQKNIYFEVLNSVLSMFHRPYLYEETTIVTEVNQIPFESKGKVEKDKGWKELYKSFPKKEEVDTELLPVVSKNDVWNAKLETKKGKTTPPKRYSEGDLINLMKTCGKSEDLEDEDKEVLKEIEGLGTEATRAAIIDTLLKQIYIEVKKNQVYVTKKGEVLCEVVNGTLLSKPELTAKWEAYLKKIGKSEGDKRSFISNTVNFIRSIVDDGKQSVEGMDFNLALEEMKSEGSIASCPTCQKGYITERPKFYGCSEYKNGCKQTFPKKLLKKTISKAQIRKLCEKGKSDKIKGFEGKKKFDGVLILKDGKVVFDF